MTPRGVSHVSDPRIGELTARQAARAWAVYNTLVHSFRSTNTGLAGTWSRPVDAFGQWTGASIVVGCHEMEPARNE